MTHDEVIQTIQKNIQASGSLREQARAWKISAAYLSDVVRKKRWPGKKILQRLGLEGKIETKRTFEAVRANGARSAARKA